MSTKKRKRNPKARDQKPSAGSKFSTTQDESEPSFIEDFIRRRNESELARTLEINNLIRENHDKAVEQANFNLSYGAEMLAELLKSPRYSICFFDASLRSGTHPVCTLVRVVRYLTKALIKTAMKGDTMAAAQVWDTSGELIKAIHELASKDPEVLKPIARKALLLPSFRAKPIKPFKCQFPFVQEAIELSKDCIINTSADAQFDLNSPATFLVATKLEAVGRLRQQMKALEANWKTPEDSIKSWKPLRRPRRKSKESARLLALLGMNVSRARKSYKPLSLTLDECLKSGGFRRDDHYLLKLPDYNKASARQWWAQVIKPYLEAPETLEQIRGTEFYDQLCAASSKGKKGTSKDSDVIDELKKRCQRQVLTSLAPPVSHRPPTI
jgi:hypothetical protein